jgi:hypothetical protein
MKVGGFAIPEEDEYSELDAGEISSAINSFIWCVVLFISIALGIT